MSPSAQADQYSSHKCMIRSAESSNIFMPECRDILIVIDLRSQELTTFLSQQMLLYQSPSVIYALKLAGAKTSITFTWTSGATGYYVLSL